MPIATHEILLALAIWALVKIAVAGTLTALIPWFDYEARRPPPPEPITWPVEHKSRVTCWVLAFVAFYLFIASGLPDPASTWATVGGGAWIAYIVWRERRKLRQNPPPRLTLALHFKHGAP